MTAQKMPEDYYEEATTEYMQSNDSAALSDYAFLVAHYPRNKFCSIAYYNMGTIYERSGNDKKSIGCYRAAIYAHNEKARDKEAFISRHEGERLSALRLSDLYTKNGSYDSALYFAYVYDTGFSKGDYYGVAGSHNPVATIKLTDIYTKANRIIEAEKVLLSRCIFQLTEYNEHEVSKRLKELFTKYEQPAKLKSEIENAINRYTLDTVNINRGGPDTLVYCRFYFLGTKVRVFYCSMNDLYKLDFGDDMQVPRVVESIEKEHVIDLLKRSELYCLIQGL